MVLIVMVMLNHLWWSLPFTKWHFHQTSFMGRFIVSMSRPFLFALSADTIRTKSPLFQKPRSGFTTPFRSPIAIFCLKTLRNGARVLPKLTKPGRINPPKIGGGYKRRKVAVTFLSSGSLSINRFHKGGLWNCERIRTRYMDNKESKKACRQLNYLGEEDNTPRFYNYCVCDIMAKCSAGSSWKEQRACKFSKKSSVGDWCMHYRKYISGHCDCVNAQKAINK